MKRMEKENVKKRNKSVSKTQKGYTIITALEGILEKAKDSKLSASFWRRIKPQTDYLKTQLEGFSEFQLVILAVMIEAGRPMSWKAFGDYFGCSRLSMMTYTEEVEGLLKKRWIKPDSCRDTGGAWYVGYSLMRGVVSAIRHNKPFEPEIMEGLTTQELIDKADRFFRNGFDTQNPEKDYLYDWVELLVNSNSELPICKFMQDNFLTSLEMSVFMIVVSDYVRYGGTEREGLDFDDLEGFLPDESSTELLMNNLRKGRHILFKLGVIEHGCDDGVVNDDVLKVTSYTKDELLADYDMSRSAKDKKLFGRDIKSCADIKEKPLFYNSEEEQQIAQLASLLQPEQFGKVQQRLEERGMRKGFACLFYGGPGTGKTETALQLAKQTGRDIMMIEIAGMKDKWVGESEKNIKAVFQRYRKLCQECERTPILFFNESDALINKRNEHAESSADKMNNSMQNILLQELEELDGILIATTNLTETLDKAFERRFIYKIGFKQPSVEVKAKIWQSKIEGLTAADALRLAKSYDLSGGQIENIARKSTVDYVLFGKDTDVDQLDHYCKNEMLDGAKSRKSVGFV